MSPTRRSAWDAPAGDGQQRLGGVEPGDAGFPSGRQLEEGARAAADVQDRPPRADPGARGSSNLAASASSSAQAAARAPRCAPGGRPRGPPRGPRPPPPLSYVPQLSTGAAAMSSDELSMFSYEILGLVGRGGAGAHDLLRMAPGPDPRLGRREPVLRRAKRLARLPRRPP